MTKRRLERAEELLDELTEHVRPSPDDMLHIGQRREFVVGQIEGVRHLVRSVFNAEPPAAPQEERTQEGNDG